MTLQETNPADTSAMLVGQRLSHIATERGGIESETVRAVNDDADTGSIDPPPKGTIDKVSVSGSAVFWLRVIEDEYVCVLVPIVENVCVCEAVWVDVAV